MPRPILKTKTSVQDAVLPAKIFVLKTGRQHEYKAWSCRFFSLLPVTGFTAAALRMIPISISISLEFACEQPLSVRLADAQTGLPYPSPVFALQSVFWH